MLTAISLPSAHQRQWRVPDQLAWIVSSLLNLSSMLRSSRTLPFSLPLVLFLSAAVVGQTRSTLCQSTDEHTALGATPVLRLVGCGIGYPDNLLWHLDRADSRTGVLDGSAYVPATGAGVVVYVIDLRIREDHVEFARPTGDVILEQLTVSRALPSGCGAGSRHRLRWLQVCPFP